MAYTNLAELQTKIQSASLAQLTDDAAGTTIDEAKVAEAIAYADELIDGYLRGRYSLPLSTVPKLISKLSIDITVYQLYARRPESGIPEAISEQYKNATSVLDRIQKGLISLGVEQAASPENLGQSEFRTNKTASDRLFNKDLMAGY